jgi:hypothetical protein
MQIKAQDILIILKMAAMDKAEPVRQLDLAAALLLSPAEVSNALKRMAVAQLFVPADRKQVRTGQLGTLRLANLCEFAIHGVRYAFPAKLGEVAVGLPTAWGALPLSKTVIAGSDGVPVWP